MAQRRCTACGAMTGMDAASDHPSLPNINWAMVSAFVEAHFEVSSQ
jgi:hypothetical protein